MFLAPAQPCSGCPQLSRRDVWSRINHKTNPQVTNIVECVIVNELLSIAVATRAKDLTAKNHTENTLRSNPCQVFTTAKGFRSSARSQEGEGEVNRNAKDSTSTIAAF
jgi:hypothetical protein